MEKLHTASQCIQMSCADSCHFSNFIAFIHFISLVYYPNEAIEWLFVWFAHSNCCKTGCFDLIVRRQKFVHITTISHFMQIFLTNQASRLSVCMYVEMSCWLVSVFLLFRSFKCSEIPPNSPENSKNTQIFPLIGRHCRMFIFLIGSLSLQRVLTSTLYRKTCKRIWNDFKRPPRIHLSNFAKSAIELDFKLKAKSSSNWSWNGKCCFFSFYSFHWRLFFIHFDVWNHELLKFFHFHLG